MISSQPAIVAGVANINIVENKGADPLGIYSPIFSNGNFNLNTLTIINGYTSLNGKVIHGNV